MKTTRTMRWAASAVAGAALTLTPLALAGSASASTAGCASGGAFAGYCSAQVDHEAAPIAFNVNGATPKAGGVVGGWTNDKAYAANDFVSLAYQGNSGEKEFIYAPNGVVSTWCITLGANNAGHNAKLVLEQCDGDNGQLFEATNAQSDGSVSWTTDSTHGGLITANGKGGQMTVNNNGAGWTPKPNQLFSFSTSLS